jgi:hypothetical protein
MTFKTKKSLGQNFLIDRNILEQIVNTVEIKDKEVIDFQGTYDEYLANQGLTG